ncbi:ferric uptake regulator, Fur family [Desulfonatronospira thiodismutans ASO3-1]|uniref:Ferric uptake regulation protein n=1 Tax=Desulfonatronospira thiodismutans ASO3-1 TaxID=555779 RepID=D6SRG0_9BACT|nr:MULTISPECIES: Fur family transcriptional regulator [Desulfonatronospira]EFI33276.1 ferric uptake regulator, Fur family [Desulfonatronospira thiodismutans ASO3-1]RQD74846.1 MAG: transcriptional repressor [Desulfonatronospira sp. MSAO_Bac3]
MQDAREQFFQYLAKQKLRFTSQRAIIFDVFWNTQGHISPEELYRKTREQDRSIGQATVYRTLKLLSDAGIAREVDFGDGVARYEPYYGQSHHDHLICKECGKNVEVVDHRIEKLQEELASQHGFTLNEHSMYLYGYCAECSGK